MPMVIAVTLGLLAGYYRGRVDTLISRLIKEIIGRSFEL